MKKTVNQKKQNFVLGAMLLMISAVLCKVIGAFFKVPLTNLIGDDGMGYFNSAYSIYGVLFTVSTAGIPVAVSRIISSYIVKGDENAVKKTFRISFIMLLIIGLLGSGGMFIFAPQLASDIIKNPDSEYAIRALAPTLFFICFEAALRGYFQGHQNMTPTSVSQVIEAIGKFLIGILGVLFAISKGYTLPIVAAYAIVGIGVGAAVSCIYLLVCKIAYNKYDYGVKDKTFVTPSGKHILAEIALIAIPITISSLVLSITNLVDSTMIMRLLQSSGMSLEEAKQILLQSSDIYNLATMTDGQILESAANILYGNYTTLAVTYYNLPLVLMTPISISIIPALSEAFTKKDRPEIDAIVDSTFRLQSTISLPCAMGLCVLAAPALSVLFTNKLSVQRAAPLLAILSVSIFFVAITSVTNAVLQSLHKQWLPIFSMLAGTVVKIAVAYFLIGNPKIGIYGAPLSTTACYLVAMLVNLFFMAKFTGCVPKISKVFIKPFICSVICAAAAYSFYKIISSLIATSRIVTLASILIAAIVYIIVLLLFKVLTERDIKLLPKGEAIYGILNKRGLIKK